MKIRENVSTSIGDICCYRDYSDEPIHEAAARSLKRRLGATAVSGGYRGQSGGGVSVYEYTFARRDGSVIQSVTLWVRN